jgi:hypothetical protein
MKENVYMSLIPQGIPLNRTLNNKSTVVEQPVEAPEPIARPVKARRRRLEPVAEDAAPVKTVPSKAPYVEVSDEPESEITFSGDFGSHTCFYHQVMVLPKVIVLLFDKSFKYGRYTPPKRSEPFIVEIGADTYWVGNVGIVFDMPVLDNTYQVTVLIRATSPVVEDEEQPEMDVDISGWPGTDTGTAGRSQLGFSL